MFIGAKGEYHHQSRCGFCDEYKYEYNLKGYKYIFFSDLIELYAMVRRFFHVIFKHRKQINYKWVLKKLPMLLAFIILIILVGLKFIAFIPYKILYTITEILEYIFDFSSGGFNSF